MQRSVAKDFDGDGASSNYPSQHCLALQQEINPKMRRTLIDWLVDVHLKYKLLPETLFICVNLIDRFSGKSLIKRKDYQMVGVTCLLIAAKYEEIYPPYVDNFVYITDHAYRREQIIEKEREILKDLAFEVTFVSSYRFLERYGKIAESSETA